MHVAPQLADASPFGEDPGLAFWQARCRNGHARIPHVGPICVLLDNRGHLQTSPRPHPPPAMQVPFGWLKGAYEF